jgi:hypothetical protein
MAAEYVRADEHALFRLAALVNLFWQGPSKEIASEIRIEQQAFGLTPLDRRRLEWSIEQAEAAQEKTLKRRISKATREAAGIDGEDPRMLLGGTK